jgi:dTMP kinase
LIGKFISLEGSEGAGKSTAQAFITKYLSAQQIPWITTREPGGTRLSEKIRQLLLQTPEGESDTIAPLTELLLMFASRSQHISEVIVPALKKGQWVISDRYVDASYAYQVYGRGLPLTTVKALDELVVGRHYPDLTLFLDVAPDIGMQRAESRASSKDRIEQESMDFFARVRQGYLVRAQAAPERIKVIDASVTLLEVEQQVIKQLALFVDQRGNRP